MSGAVPGGHACGGRPRHGMRAVRAGPGDNAGMSILEGPVKGATRTEIGGLVVDEVAAGAGRIKRVIYPPGWRWSTDMGPITHTDRCMHAHVGFLVQGAMVTEYADGCRVESVAPAALVIAPGHDGWVVGDEAAVLIQYDCGPQTCERLGLPAEHRH